MENRVRLVSFDGCPYVQRTVIALRAKGVAHDVTLIDLAAKPDWFLALNPRGKVPVVIVDGTDVVYESAVINEYLEELHPEPALLPAGPYERAVARMWIEYCNSYVMDAVSGALFAKTRSSLDAALGQLDERLGLLEAELAKRPGPYFFGDAFSLVEATYAPAFERMLCLTAFYGWRPSGALESTMRWRDATWAHPAVAGTLREDIVERYRPWYERQQAEFAANGG